MQEVRETSLWHEKSFRITSLTLVITGLPTEYLRSVHCLRQAFEVFGGVESAKVLSHGEGRFPKPVAYLTMRDQKEFNAVLAMGVVPLFGQLCRVTEFSSSLYATSQGSSYGEYTAEKHYALTAKQYSVDGENIVKEAVESAELRDSMKNETQTRESEREHIHDPSLAKTHHSKQVEHPSDTPQFPRWEDDKLSPLVHRKVVVLRNSSSSKQPAHKVLSRTPLAAISRIFRNLWNTSASVPGPVSKSPPSGKRFTVATWNTLYPKFTSACRQYCPDQYLRWREHRAPRVLAAIRELRPAILALQEVGERKSSDYRSFYAQLEREGYALCVVPKVISESTASVGGRDSICLAYLVDQFLPVEAFGTKGFQIIMLPPTNSHVGCIAALQHRTTQRYVIAATSHLKADKLEEDTRKVQLQALLHKVAEANRKVLSLHQDDFGGRLSSRSTPRAPPPPSPLPPCDAVILGDFNSEPRWGLLRAATSAALCAPLGGLREVYSDHAPVAFFDKQYTCLMPHTQDQVDYVFHTTGLEATRLLRVPSNRDVVAVSRRDFMGHARAGEERTEHLPTPSYPSDHILLWAEFGFGGEGGR